MAYPIYNDDFEKKPLDPKKWHARQVPNEKRQILYTNDASSGKKSITIRVSDGDGGVSCNNCQRAEIRTHGKLRPSHADKFWHAFSFKVSGDIPSSGSVRTVLGQWKAPEDDSPLLAQRFDNGVFHVTVQDGPNRRTVASAVGDPDRLDLFQDLVSRLTNTAPELLHTSRAMADLKLFQTTSEEFSGVQEKEFAENLIAMAKDLANAPVSETQKLFDEFSYIHDIEEYALPAKFSTKRFGEKKLPDPKVDWVRMAYRIKAGREDNDSRYGPKRVGEIDIYANGDLIAEVRGDIGYRISTLQPDPSVYFKFGIYRDVIPGTLEFHFDQFAQGSQYSDVM